MQLMRLSTLMFMCRWLRPTLELVGIYGGVKDGIKTIVPSDGDPEDGGAAGAQPEARLRSRRWAASHLDARTLMTLDCSGVQDLYLVILRASHRSACAVLE